MGLKDQVSLIYDVFSRRRAPKPIGYQDEPITDRLRGKLLVLYRDVIAGRRSTGPGYMYSSEDNTYAFWDQVYNSFEYLYGPLKVSNPHDRHAAEAANIFVSQCSTDEFFDFIELSFRVEIAFRFMRDANDFVDALNELFRMEGSPYRVTHSVRAEESDTEPPYRRGGKVTRTVAHPRVVNAEDDVIHTEAIAPALSTLSAPHFESANLEFRDALEEYRKGHYGDCLTKCGSSFESVLKVLCERNRWQSSKDNTAALLHTVITNSTLDSFFEQPLILIATMRNKLSSSHGGGPIIRTVERHVAQYALASTAAAIVLLTHELGGS